MLEAVLQSALETQLMGFLDGIVEVIKVILVKDYPHTIQRHGILSLQLLLYSQCPVNQSYRCTASTLSRFKATN